MQPAISFQSISKTYRGTRGWLDWLPGRGGATGDKRALQNVSFLVRPGEIVSLLGPNGSGKTTAIKILSSLITPTEGNAAIAGFDTKGKSLQSRAQIGYCMAEERSFYFRLTGRQNLRFFGRLRGLSHAAVDRDIKRLEPILRHGDLDGRFMTYSTGMKQKLSLFRALIGNAPVLLLDEPTRGLDPHSTKMFLDELRAYARDRGTAILLASHDLDAVDRVSDRLLFLHRGRLLADDTPDEVLRRFSIPQEVVIEVRDPDESFRAALRRTVGDGAREELDRGGGTVRFTCEVEGAETDWVRFLREQSGAHGGVVRLSWKPGSLESLFARFSVEDGDER